jgi:hypothetical protein
MKTTLIALAIGTLCMALGAAQLFTTHETHSLIWGLTGVVIGFWIITYELCKLVGRSHVYRFLHNYQHSNHLINNTTIISELTRDEITQLKEFDKYLFLKKPIIVDRIIPLSLDVEGQSNVLGWIIAHNKAEAIRTLHYTEDFDQYMYPEIFLKEVYSGTEDWDL